MSTIEILSVRELRRRLGAIEAESGHLKRRLPVDSPYNRMLTLYDISRWCRQQTRWMRYHMKDAPPQGVCEHRCPSVNECRKAPPCRKIEPYLQRRLSVFFHGWDSGTLVKACRNGVWGIYPRGEALAQMDAQAGQKAHACHVDFNTGRLKL